MTPDRWQAEFQVIASQPFPRARTTEAQRRELQQMARDDNFEHFGRTFVDPQGANVAVEAFGDGALDQPISAVDLQTAIDRPLGGLGGEELGDGRFVGDPLRPLVFFCRRPMDEESAGLDLDCALR